MDVRPDQVNAHQQRQKHADEHRGQRQKIILKADDFMIETEDQLAKKPLRSRAAVTSGAGKSPGSHICSSPSVPATNWPTPPCLSTFTMPASSNDPSPQVPPP